MILAGFLVQAAMLVFFFGVAITLIVLKGVMMARGELGGSQASTSKPSHSPQADPDQTKVKSNR